MVTNYDNRCGWWLKETWVSEKSYCSCCWWCDESPVTRQKKGLNQRVSFFRYLHTQQTVEEKFEIRGPEPKYRLWEFRRELQGSYTGEPPCHQNQLCIVITSTGKRPFDVCAVSTSSANYCFRILEENHWFLRITLFWVWENHWFLCALACVVVESRTRRVVIPEHPSTKIWTDVRWPPTRKFDGNSFIRCCVPDWCVGRWCDWRRRPQQSRSIWLGRQRLFRTASLTCMTDWCEGVHFKSIITWVPSR